MRERTEILADVRAAVLGTTDMIESLLIFSRSGASVRRSPQLLAEVVERAVTLVRAHPDAEGVSIEFRSGDPADTAAAVDAKQVERAIFNLLLNACQSQRTAGIVPHVAAVLETVGDQMLLSVIDNGRGVPEKIRDSLFEPFVSEGKQKGTGLGLTLASRVAAEHGGEVVLLSSRSGETIFQMKVARAPRAKLPAVSTDQVIPNENMRM
jgi:signal transduction histidine kinase